MTKYISSSFIFAAALLAVVGDSSDPARKGIDKVTPLGWIAITIAVLSFTVTVIETRRDRRKANWQERQRFEVRGIANRQVLTGLRRLLRPFHDILFKFFSELHMDFDLDRLDDDLNYCIELLSRPTVRNNFATINVHQWGKFFSETTRDADTLLNDAITKYSGYLKPETIVKVEELRIDDFVRVRMAGMDEHVLANAHIPLLPLDDALFIFDGHMRFDLMLDKVRQLIGCVDGGGQV